MAKVNTKFIIILSGGILGAVGLAVLAMKLVFKSPAELAATASDFAAKGEYAAAAAYQAKAVHKDQTNAQYLIQWRDYLRKYAAPDATRCLDALLKLDTSMYQLGIVQKDDVAVQKEYLEALLARTRGSVFDNDQIRGFIGRVEEFLSRHDTSIEGEWAGLERYKGWALARVAIASPDIKPEELSEAIRSLEAALKKDQNDLLATLAYEELYTVLAQRALKAQKPDEAAVLSAKAESALDGFVARNPDSPEALLRKAARQFDSSLALIQGEPDMERRKTLSADLTRDLVDRLDAISNLVKSGKFKDPDSVFRSVFKSMETLMSPGTQLAKTLAIFDALLKAKPSDSELLIEYGMALADVGKYAEAIAAVDTVQKLPALTTSIEALRLFEHRTSAIFLEGLWTIKSADDSSLTQAEKDQKLERAKELRGKLATLVDSESNQLLLMNAYIAYMDNNYAEAGRFVDRFNTKTRGGDRDSQWLMHLIQVRLGNLGEAKKALQACVMMNRRDMQAIMAFADIEARLRNFDEALQVVNEVLELYPQYTPATRLRENILTLKGEGTSTDPVVRLLFQADNLARELAGQTDGDRKVLEFLQAEAPKYPGDFRMLRAVALAHLKVGDREKAKELLESALAAKPEDSLTKNLLESLTNSDQVAAEATMIEQSSSPPIDKFINLWSHYRMNNRQELAAKALADAKAINPSDTRVIEAEFIVALTENKLDEAQRLVELATQQNVDGRNGLSFRARLLAVRGDHTGAIAAIQQAMDMGNPGPELYRLLGNAHNGAGNPSEAVKAYEKAIDARPNDVESINALIGTLIQLNRRTDALAAAKKSEKYALSSNDFRHMWYALEADVGDRKLAVAARERQARTSPGDRRNLLALAGLYIQDKNWPEARQSIEAARRAKDGDDIIILLANWHWMQDQKAEARKVFTDTIAARSGDAALGAVLGFANFLMQQGEFEEGTKVLRDSRSLQDPKTLQVDRALAEVLYLQRQFEEAAAVTKSIIDTLSPAPIDYQQRYAECLLLTGKGKEAAEVLRSLFKPGQEDVTTLLLLADASNVLSDPAGERAALDQAASRFPNDFRIFKRRGTFFLNLRSASVDEQRQYSRDAKEDFDIAIRLKADDWESYRFRALAQIAIDQDRGYASAVQDLREAIRLNPNNDELFYGLIADLLRKNPPRAQEAMAVAEEGVARRPNDMRTLLALGELFSTEQQYPEAVRFLRAAFEMDNKNPESAQRLLNALLRQKPPLLTDAEAVLQRVQSQVERNPGFLMAFAKIRIQQNRIPEADSFALNAVKLLDPKNPRQMLDWFSDIQSVQPDKTKVVLFLEKISSMGVTPEADEWLRFLRANLLASEKQKESEGLAALATLSTGAKLPVLRRLSYSVIGSNHYAAARYAEAAKNWEDAVKTFPDDYESMNNLAYTYLKFLDRKTDALKWAELAAANIKASADVQDTYGLALAANGRSGEAIAIYRNALLLASTAQSEVTICVHLGSALLDAGNREDAFTVTERAVRTVEESPEEVTDDVKAELAALKAKVGL